MKPKLRFFLFVLSSHYTDYVFGYSEEDAKSKVPVYDHEKILVWQEISKEDVDLWNENNG